MLVIVPEREGYTHLNADFQKTVQKDKKDFFNEPCIKLEGNKRKRKNRDLLVEDIKGMFHPQMGTIKIRNGKDVVDAEEIKKRWKECTGQGRCV